MFMVFLKMILAQITMHGDEAIVTSADNEVELFLYVRLQGHKSQLCPST